MFVYTKQPKRAFVRARVAHYSPDVNQISERDLRFFSSTGFADGHSRRSPLCCSSRPVEWTGGQCQDGKTTATFPNTS